MNRRGFLRGTVSVLAIATILKGRVRDPWDEPMPFKFPLKHHSYYEHFRGTPKPGLMRGGRVYFIATPSGENVFIDSYNWEKLSA